MAKPALALTPETRIAELIEAVPLTREVLTAFGLQCTGCSVSRTESIEQGVKAHNLSLDAVMNALDQTIRTGKIPRISDADRKTQTRAPGAFAGPNASVRAIVPIMSGKGGVGKSFTTALLAVALRRRNLRVGIIDADITGPSIPRLFGLREPLDVQPDPNTPAGQRPRGLFAPAVTRSAIEIVSSNLLTEEEDTAMIWRGPIVSGVIKQFYEQTLWSDLDILLLDLPPGTSDAPLTVLQSLPIAGVVLVTMPQALATMIVRKAARLIQHVNRKVIGVVENMSYFETPDTHVRYEVFGHSMADEVLMISGAPMLGKLPIDAGWLEKADTGRIEDIDDPRADALATEFLRVLEPHFAAQKTISLL
jgi:hybrid cluster-associated redox disulfide protein